MTFSYWEDIMNWPRPTGFKGLYVFLTLLLIYPNVLFAAKSMHSQARLSDMFDCNRIEVVFESSAFEYLTRLIGRDEPFLFSPTEKKFLKSLKKTVCDDRDTIFAYAYNLRNGIHTGTGEGRAKYRTQVIGYKDDEKILSYKISDGAPLINKGSLLAESGDSYSFQGGFPTFPAVMEKELGPYLMRSYCAVKLGFFGGDLIDLVMNTKRPKLSEWCDVIGQRMLGLGLPATKSQGGIFECPGAKTSHFALNAHCTAGSPSGTILLFESKPGWNQRGGPELFSMDNHKPKGGHVLLKDGTMMFVRSYEELKRLHWK
jgi:hypothetical protein